MLSHVLFRFYITTNAFIDILVKMASSLASIAETQPENCDLQ